MSKPTNVLPNEQTDTHREPSIKQQLFHPRVFLNRKKDFEMSARPARNLRVLFLGVVVLVLAISGFARMYEEPRSFKLRDKSQDQVQRKILPRVDKEKLQAEDRARGKDPRRPGPQRFAIAQDVVFTLENSGTWQELPDGRLWRLRIHSPEATSHNLGITRFDMPEGAKLWIYDPEHKEVEGPYTSRHRSRRGSLWTPIIRGDEIVIEVFVAKGASQPKIEIRKVNQGYQGLNKAGVLGGVEGACNNDVICPEGDPWRDQIRSVGVYTINGTGSCTGTLLNNTALDWTPYFLSANHCGVSAANEDTVVVFWNFQSPTCGPHDPGSLADTQTGSFFRASSAASDFLLLELDDPVDPAFNLFYAGWDATGVAPPSTVAIHHPRGDVMAITFSNSAPQSASWTTGAPDPAGNHWFADWDDGVTEPGSSGGCLFSTTDRRCIGQLHGGLSACGAPAANMNDLYGKFSVSWTGGGTNATRLSNWLDPVGGGTTLGMDGDTHITTADGVHYDFQADGEFISLRDPDGLEIQTRMTGISTSFFPGPDPYDGLATCVSINTAVAARVGQRRVTIQPNISGVPDPSGLQVRIDGALTTVGPGGVNLGFGASIAKVGDVFQINFPSGTVLTVTPLFWNDQGKWYMNVDVLRGAGREGVAGGEPGNVSGTGGLMAAIAPGSWLPALPDGTTMGSMPGSLQQRYVDLYQKFGEAWRVTDQTSLFDYGPGTSTKNFTNRSWPKQNAPCTIPNTRVARPLDLATARRLCRGVTDKNMKADCIFDVRVTGEPGFAKLYGQKQQIRNGSTVITLDDAKNPTKPGERVTLTATVSRRTSHREVPSGTVQFILDGENVGQPVRLDRSGNAKWTIGDLKAGKHQVSARYIPARGSIFMSSSSRTKVHTVRDDY